MTRIFFRGSSFVEVEEPIQQVIGELRTADGYAEFSPTRATGSQRLYVNPNQVVFVDVPETSA